MMHISNIIDPHACVFDVCMMPISMMRLKFCLGPTNEQADSRSWIGLHFPLKGKIITQGATAQPELG